MMRNQAIVDVLLSMQPGVTELEYGLCCVFAQAADDKHLSFKEHLDAVLYVLDWRDENRAPMYVSRRGTWGRHRRRLYADILAHFSEEVAHG